jgi:hypothetical protein
MCRVKWQRRGVATAFLAFRFSFGIYCGRAPSVGVTHDPSLYPSDLDSI